MFLIKCEAEHIVLLSVGNLK